MPPIPGGSPKSALTGVAPPDPQSLPQQSYDYVYK